VTAEVFDFAVIREAMERATTAEEVAEREAAVRTDLAGAVGHLTFLRDVGAHTLTGFGSWGAYVVDRFGDLLAELRLAVEDRREVVHALRGEGRSMASIARELRVSEDTVARDLAATGDPAPERITSADGSSRVARTGRAEAPAGKLWERAAEVARRRGARGVTLVELARALSVTEGSASGLLTYLRGKGLVARTEERRRNQRVHVAVDTADRVAGVISGATEDRP
jgi:DNA-binding transcriptional ArsR family regulator